MRKIFYKGLWAENPILMQLLGFCPALAVTTSALNGLSMGLATSFVVVTSGVVVSLVRKLIPDQVRIPVFTIIIATFVTVVDIILKAYFPAISTELGPYVPLIVVNCIILGRQEVFTSKNPVHLSILDTLGMGLGFTWVLVLLGSIRELLGLGSVFGFQVMPSSFETWIVMLLPGGAFITLGLIAALYNYLNQSDRRKA
ncbi:MAG: electron transport complex subunit RsxE [Elusimicrobia bacterium]|nr:electron transport complex subunit RsxE [Elusimicrobiota bacterium]